MHTNQAGKVTSTHEKMHISKSENTRRSRNSKCRKWHEKNAILHKECSDKKAADFKETAINTKKKRRQLLRLSAQVRIHAHAHTGHALLYMGVAKSNHTLPPFPSVLSPPPPTPLLSVVKE